jgi:predicted PurR-regulated permease PerM
MTRDKLFSLFFLVLLGFILFHVYQVFTPFLATGFWAFIIVFAFYPIFERLNKLLNNNQTLSALLMSLLIVAVVVVPVIYLTLYLSGTALNLYVTVRELVQSGEWQTLIEKIRAFPATQFIENGLSQLGFITTEDLSGMALNASKEAGNFLASNLATFTKNIVLYCLHFILMVCLAFLFFKNGQGIIESFYKIVPLSKESKSSISSTLNNTLTAIIRGQFITSLVQGIMAGIIFYFLGMKLFVFLGILTFLASMIPILGATSVWAPVAIYFFATNHFTEGLIMALTGFFGISLIDNFLKPLLIGSGAKMSVFVIFLSILGGLTAYGLSGIFIGPVVMAVFFALIKIFQEQYISKTD